MSALAIHPNAEPIALTPEARAAINAANAQLSCGPKTPEGKDRVKFNALKTGIFARTVVLPGEQQSAYEALGARLIQLWSPSTHSERELVLTILNTTWRLDRIVQLESSLFAIGAIEHLEEMEKLFPDQIPSTYYALAEAAGYKANARAFDQLSRQEGRLQRALNRANREIESMVSMRPEREPEPPAQPTEAEPAHAPETAPATPTPIRPTGFVPSKSPANMPVFTGKKAKQHRRAWLIKNGHLNLA